MKIAYVTPGSGGTFYCQNCFRDSDLLKSLDKLGHEVLRVPMYLPATIDDERGAKESPVFFGAINVYLKEKLPFYRHAPVWLERFFDSPALLQFAAKKSGSVKATGLEEMTISMLLGEKGHQASELDQLIQYLHEIKPDVVHLSNALLLGLAHRLKKDLGAGVICSLQDENEWIDLMEVDYREKVWQLMGEKAADVDLFVTTSRFYSEKSRQQLHIPAHKIKVVAGGIDLAGYETSPLPFELPVIGYLCRMSEYFGLGILTDAFIKLKKESRFSDVRLHVTGGYTADDKPFVNQLMKKINESGYGRDVKIFKYFDRAHRVKFLKTLTLLSVPVPGGEAFGAYQVEALAAGVPVAQPKAGCFPEFVETTKGGIIYDPNTSDTLSEALASLLAAPERIRQMGKQGRKAVLEEFTMANMAGKMAAIYREVVSN